METDHDDIVPTVIKSFGVENKSIVKRVTIHWASRQRTILPCPTSLLANKNASQ